MKDRAGMKQSEHKCAMSEDGYIAMPENRDIDAGYGEHGRRPTIAGPVILSYNGQRTTQNEYATTPRMNAQSTQVRSVFRLRENSSRAHTVAMARRHALIV